MSNNVNVKFSVTGSELSSYIESIKKKSDALAATAITSAIEQNKHSRDQLAIIDQQIKAIERRTRMEGQATRSIIIDKRDVGLSGVRDRFDADRNAIYADKTLTEKEKKERIIASHGSQTEAELNVKNQYRENLNSVRENERQGKLQTQLAKEQIDTLKDTANKNITAIKSGDLKLVDVISTAQTSDEKLVARLTEEGVREEKKKEKGSNDGRIGGSVFNDILRAETFNKAFDIGSKLSQSKNGYDMISETLSAPTNFLATLTSGIPLLEGIFKLINKGAEAAAEFKERQAISRQGYLKESFRYNAVTGSNAELSTDMSMSGVSATDFLKYRSDFAKRRGYSIGSNDTARDAIFAERGYGIDQATSANIVELQRSNHESNRGLAELIGGILERGQGNIFKNGDHSFLNEFLGKFSTLQKELLKNQTTVSSGTTMDILSRFNKIGGEFDVRDTRSQGNINAIQSGLSNPNSDNAMAMSYRILSQQNPNAGIFDLKEKMSQGLGNPEYLKGVLKLIDQIGGGDQTKMMNLSGRFPGLSMSATRRLYNNRMELMNGSISMDELKGQFPDEFKDRAEANTNQMDKSTANIETQIVDGTRDAIKTLMISTKDAILDAFSGAVININGQNGTIEFIRPAIKTNTKTSPTKQWYDTK